MGNVITWLALVVWWSLFWVYFMARVRVLTSREEVRPLVRRIAQFA